MDPPIVLYDADCGFCRWSLAKLMAWDRQRRLRSVAISSAEGELLLSDLSSSEREASWHFVDRHGARSSAGAAVAPLLRELPGGRAPASLAARLPRLTEAAYDWLADHRSLLSKLIPAAAVRRADARIRGRDP